MRWLVLFGLWAVPLQAATHFVAIDVGIAAPRFAEGDLDGDGRAELVVGGRVGPFRPVTDPLEGRRARIAVQFMENGLLRRVVSNDELPVVEDVAIGDFDGDGRAEIVAVGWYRLWTLALKDGELVVLGSEVLAQGQFARVDAADVDGDGRAEVLVTDIVREPGSEVVSTLVSVYRFDRTWQRVAQMDLQGHVGDLCLGDLSGRGRVSLALELGGEEVGGVLQVYDFVEFAPQFSYSQQVTQEHVRALSLHIRRFSGRSLLAVADIGGRIGLFESHRRGLLESAVVQAPGASLRGVHLTQLFVMEGVQILGGSGGRSAGALWIIDGF